MKKPAGFILYEGNSVLDNQPIVMIATLGTENTKTGNLIQTWILCRDVHPTEAINDGRDVSVCGNCPLRGILAKSIQKKDGRIVNRHRGCYVSVTSGGPSAVWKSYKRGNYPKFDYVKHPKFIRSRGLRLGSYGEPTAVPIEVVRPYVWLSGRKCPGYTHQWRSCNLEWRDFIMASVHSEDEANEAQSLGWRTFRTRKEGQELLENEIVCPASKEGGFRLSCAECGACSGGSSDKASVAIIAHGAANRQQNVLRVIENLL